MSYDVAHSILNSLINITTITSITVLFLHSASQSWSDQAIKNRQKRRQLEKSGILWQLEKTEQGRLEALSSLSVTKLDLQTCQQVLQKAYQKLNEEQQENAILKTDLETIRLELKKTSNELEKGRHSYLELKDRASVLEVELQNALQDLQFYERGLQGFMNRRFKLDRAAKIRLKKFWQGITLRKPESPTLSREEKATEMG